MQRDVAGLETTAHVVRRGHVRLVLELVSVRQGLIREVFGLVGAGEVAYLVLWVLVPKRD